MIGFEYKYVKAIDIIKDIILVPQDSIIYYVIIVMMVIIFLLLLYYIIPCMNMYGEYLQDEKNKKKRKKNLQEIILTKNIEEEIERELNI